MKTQRPCCARLIAGAGLALGALSPAFAATTVNLTLYPNYPGLQGTLPLGVSGDAATGFGTGSWQANVTGVPLFTSILLDTMTLFGRDDVRVEELASVRYWTKKSGPEGSVDWFFQFYTDPYVGSPGAAWYGHRINSEPYFSDSLNAPASQWNQWVSEAGGDNRLRFYDSSNNYFGSYTDPFLDGPGGLTTLTYPIPAWNLNSAYPDLGPQEIWYFVLGLGTAWSNGFQGRIDGIRIELTDGSVATVNLEDFPLPSVALEADESCYDGGVGQTVTIDLELTGNTDDEIVGGQFFIEYDPAVLQFVSAAPVGPEFPLEVFEFHASGYLQYAVGVGFGDPGTTGDATMARLTFTVLDDSACSVLDVVAFDTLAFLPNRLTDEFGASILPDLVALGTVTFDSEAPLLSVPSNITIECDESTLPANTGSATASDNCTATPNIVIGYSDSVAAGSCPQESVITRTWTATDECGNQSSGIQTITVEDTSGPSLSPTPPIAVYADAGDCSAVVALCNSESIEEFTDPVVIGPTQAPGVWYTDRYPPFGFANAFFDDDDRLKHSIDASDCSPCRPGGFNGVFYDTQGRKYDTPGATAMSIALYVPADWATTGRRMAGFWGTAFNAGNAISLYPILEFTSDGANPRFRGYNNGPWIDLGLPSGFVYDAWYTLEIEIVGGDVVYTVGDLSATIPALGSVQIGNVILQGHNNTAGVTYDIYWDDFETCSPAPSATDNCDPAPSVVGVRNDAQPLDAPYPAGITTITWTATDACGNSTVQFQTINVAAFTPLAVTVEYFGVVAAGPFTRCIEFELYDCDTNSVIWSDEADFVFVGGVASGTIELPCGTDAGACLRARDAKHSLRSTAAVAIVGLGYEASFEAVSLVDPGNALLLGNANGDTFVDILDFGVFAGQFNTAPGASTPCGYLGFNADFDGSGLVDGTDFSFIQIHFFDFDALCVCPLPMVEGPAKRPMSRVRVTDLRRMGYPNPHKADLNEDGWVDATDVALFAAGL